MAIGCGESSAMLGFDMFQNTLKVGKSHTERKCFFSRPSNKLKATSNKKKEAFLSTDRLPVSFIDYDL